MINLDLTDFFTMNIDINFVEFTFKMVIFGLDGVDFFIGFNDDSDLVSKNSLLEKF